MSLLLGGVIGFLTSEKLSVDKQLSDLAGRLTSLQDTATSENLSVDQQLSDLAGRLTSLQVTATSENLSVDKQLSDLTSRLTSIEVTATLAKLKDEEIVSELTGRVSILEKQALVARAPDLIPAVAAAPLNVSLEGAPVRGPMDAPVTIVEFSDFQCPFCSRVHPTLQRLLAAYPDAVRLVFKHYPLGFHLDAPLAHRASMAADRQGRFWDMHDKIIANYRDLSRQTLIEHATVLDLDLAQFTRDLDSSELADLLNREIAEGNKLGITGTPTFYINGKVVSGAQPYENFKAIIDREVARSG
jgi:protein-disulfide isomerase